MLVLEMKACPQYGSLNSELKSRLYVLYTEKADKVSICSALGLPVPASSASSSASSAIPSMDYEKQTVAQLKELCAQRGLFAPTKAKKADYIVILKSAATPVAASAVINESNALQSAESETEAGHSEVPVAAGTTGVLMMENWSASNAAGTSGAVINEANALHSAESETEAGHSEVPVAAGTTGVLMMENWSASNAAGTSVPFAADEPVVSSEFSEANPSQSNTVVALMTAPDVSVLPEKRNREIPASLFIAANKGHARNHYQIHFGQGIPNPIFDQVSSSTSTRLKSFSHTPPRKQIVSRIVLHV